MIDAGKCAEIGWKCVKIGSAAMARIVHVAPWMIAAYLAAHPIPADCWKDCHWVIPPEEFRAGGMFAPGTHPPLTTASKTPDETTPDDTGGVLAPLPDWAREAVSPTPFYPPAPPLGGGVPIGPIGGQSPPPPFGGPPPGPFGFTIAAPLPPLLPSQPPSPVGGTTGHDVPRFLPPPSHSVTAIAEPRSIALLAAALGGLALLRRARRPQ